MSKEGKEIETKLTYAGMPFDGLHPLLVIKYEDGSLALQKGYGKGIKWHPDDKDMTPDFYYEIKNIEELKAINEAITNFIGCLDC